MQAAYMTAHGGNELLQVGERPDPVVKSGQLMVRVHAASVNPIDWKVGQGYFRLVPGQRMPCILGSDFSGVIESVGDSVSGFAVGDEVMGLLGGGVGHTFAELVAAPARFIVRKPANISHAEAASLPLAGATALNALRGKVSAGDRVLIAGASGGVGSFAVQYAKSLGAEVIATCSKRNHDLVSGLGADQVIDYQTTDPVDQVDQIKFIFDTVGSLDPEPYWPKMVRGGAIGSTGTGPRDMHALVDRFGKNMWLMAGMADAVKQKLRGKRRFGVNYRMVFGMPGKLAMAEIARLAEAGAVRAVIQQEFALADIREAFELSQSGRVAGKLIIKLGDDGRQPAG
ncbi:MAG: NADP-dependent oxidoreductase [Gammaproteobacteria bacterium]